MSACQCTYMKVCKKFQTWEFQPLNLSGTKSITVRIVRAFCMERSVSIGNVGRDARRKYIMT